MQKSKKIQEKNPVFFSVSLSNSVSKNPFAFYNFYKTETKHHPGKFTDPWFNKYYVCSLPQWDELPPYSKQHFHLKFSTQGMMMQSLQGEPLCIVRGHFMTVEIADKYLSPHYK